MASEMRLIDANELTNFFGFMRKMWSGSEIMNVIDEAKTVDAVEVVHGRWIEKQERITMVEDDVDIYWVCSVCGTTEIGKTNYCHNCGATMDGGTQDGL